MNDLDIENFKNLAEVEEMQGDVQVQLKEAKARANELKKLRTDLDTTEKENQKEISLLENQLEQLKVLHRSFNENIKPEGQS